MIMSEVFLDTETTGLSFKDGHKIVEIACIETKDLIPTGNVFHKLINPKRSMPNEAFKVHGYSDEFLSDKKKFSEICSKFDLKILAERELNVDRNLLGELAKKSCPRIIHAFISPKKNNDTENLEVSFFKIKKYLDNNF